MFLIFYGVLTSVSKSLALALQYNSSIGVNVLEVCLQGIGLVLTVSNVLWDITPLNAVSRAHNQQLQVPFALAKAHVIKVGMAQGIALAFLDMQE